MKLLHLFIIITLILIGCDMIDKKIDIGEVSNLKTQRYSYDVKLPKNLSGWWLNIRPQKTDDDLMNTVVKVEIINNGESDFEIFVSGGTSQVLGKNKKMIIYHEQLRKHVLDGWRINCFSKKDDLIFKLNVNFEKQIPLTFPIDIYALQSDSI